MSSTYADLCRDLSREFGAEHIETLADEGFIEIEGVAVALDADDEDKPTTLTCYVDLGEVGEGNRLDLLQNVLSTNLELVGTPYGSIGLDEETDHLVLSRTVAWGAGPASSAVMAMLRTLAQFAADFRVHSGNSGEAKSAGAEYSMALMRG